MTTDRLQRLALIVWTTVGAVALAWVFLYVAGAIRFIWLPLAFAAGIVFLLEPLVQLFVRRGMPRVVATILSFLVTIALIVLVSSLVWPTLRAQGEELVTQLPDLYSSVIQWLNDAAARLDINLDQALSLQTIEEWLRDPANQDTIQNVLFGFGTGASAVIRGVAETIAVIGLAPVLALYLLIDLERFKKRSLQLTPPKSREEVAYVTGEVSTALGSFVRGQLVVALIVGILSSFGMWVIDLPFWLLIGLVAGFLNMIPFLGPFVGGALAALVALLAGNFWQAVWAVVIMIVVQQIDNHLITPMIQRTRVNLSPLVIVLALVIGGSLAGLLGVLIAVPVTAAARILVGHLWRTRVLGQSWQEASQAMIEVTEPPERLARLGRRNPDQSRLFDTEEMSAVEPDDPTDTP
jgi:predicted PurR-regulated permease PerM